MKQQVLSEPVLVNDPLEAKYFFEEFDIPYKEITEGENKGRLLVKPTSPEDYHQIHEAEKMLRRSRLHEVIDHPNVFLDREDNVIVTFSPYSITQRPPRCLWLEMSEHSIYGNDTKTFVVRFSRADINKAEMKVLDQEIQALEERVLYLKKQYEKEKEKLTQMQAELDRLYTEKREEENSSMDQVKH